jgi:hypothetical protein
VLRLVSWNLIGTVLDVHCIVFDRMVDRTELVDVVLVVASYEKAAVPL